MARMATTWFLTVFLLHGAYATDGTVHLHISRNSAVQAQQIAQRSPLLPRRDLSKRASDTVTAILGNAVIQGEYLANITVGTPAQPLQVFIDTGSSDVWVPSSKASICLNETAGGCVGGSCESLSVFARNWQSPG